MSTLTLPISLSGFGGPNYRIQNLPRLHRNIFGCIDGYVSRSNKILSALEKQKSGFCVGTSVCFNGSVYHLTRVGIKKHQLNTYNSDDAVMAGAQRIGKLICEVDGLSAGKLIGGIEKELAKTNGHRLDEPGCIYLVTDGKYTKIGGTSYAVRKRLNELQVGNAKKLKLVGSYKVQHKISTEGSLHSDFAGKRVLGEWFLLDEMDVYKILSERKDVINNSKFSGLGASERAAIDAAVQWLDYEYSSYCHKIHKRALLKSSPDAYESQCRSMLEKIIFMDRLMNGGAS